MIVSPARVLLMDGISTGLDTSTTFQIITCLRHLAHLTESTIMVSLLQPAPETFNLFDDIILMAEGRIVYHGPRTSVLDFFKCCGFKCSTRKGVWYSFGGKGRTLCDSSPIHGRTNSQQDLLNILGAMFIFVQLTGIGNCSAVLPFIAMECNVIYRDSLGCIRCGPMHWLSFSSRYRTYFSKPFCFTYLAIGFYASTYKLFWYFYSMFCTLLYFNYFGMMLVSLSSTYQVGSVWASFSYTMLNLFSGYLIPGPRIPVWWRWVDWTCLTAWTLKGLLALQFRDLTTDITVSGGGHATISGFLGSYLGYHYDRLGLVASVFLVFPLAFACIFSIAIVKLNFQKRWKCEFHSSSCCSWQKTNCKCFVLCK